MKETVSANNLETLLDAIKDDKDGVVFSVNAQTLSHCGSNQYVPKMTDLNKSLDVISETKHRSREPKLIKHKTHKSNSQERLEGLEKNPS